MLNKAIENVLEVNKKIRSKETLVNQLKTKQVVEEKNLFSNDRSYKLKKIKSKVDFRDVNDIFVSVIDVMA